MSSLPRISDTEWEVMKVIWEKAPCTSGEIIDRLTAIDPTWHPKTVKTLLNRLVKKKALGYRKEGRSYLYRPLVKETDGVKAESDSFLQRVFGGALQPMLAHFVESKKLSSAEIAELKRLLDQKGK
ncbi:MAG TPA: BlaI/MecI/CopY family transcriptional regulator [Roseimicrobium sp.]|nr:BlaI/MecI/CopY family transcriptional regulator [Roseimicrobium sp.]